MAVVDHDSQFLKLSLSDAEEHDLIEYLNCFNLGQTDAWSKSRAPWRSTGTG
jgi:hypothetical protein